MKKQNVKKGGFPISPLSDRVVIEAREEKAKKTDSGIFIPDTVVDDRGAKRGFVVAVGPGRTEEGKVVPLAISTGDEVLFQWGDKVMVEGKEYFITRESEVIAIIS
jgi:chaperonin GroES